VAYWLKYADEALAFLRSHGGLTREGRIRLFVNIDFDLRQQGDFYNNDPGRRISSDPLRFTYVIIFRDPPGWGPLHQFRFIVNAAAAVHGVLEIEYVDEV
jgi:hypothetical protein